MKRYFVDIECYSVKYIFFISWYLNDFSLNIIFITLDLYELSYNRNYIQVIYVNERYFEYWTSLSRCLYLLVTNENLPAGAGADGLIAVALTRLSKLTSAEFSPKKDCGVFFTAPVLAGRVSAMPLRSKGSPPDDVPPI